MRRRNYRAEDSHRGTTTQRGYGQQHQVERARVSLIVEAGRAVCSRCHRPIRPGEPWHLDHADLPAGIAHRTGTYLGPAHRSCNLAARNRAQRQQRPAALSIFDPPSKP